MFFVDFLIASTVAAILSGVVFIAWGRRSVRQLWPAFLVVLLLAWAGGIWYDRLGEPLGAFHWVPFLVVGVLSTIALAALVLPKKPHHLRTENHHAGPLKQTRFWAAMASSHPMVDVGVFFYIFMGAMVTSIVAFYILKVPSAH